MTLEQKIKATEELTETRHSYHNGYLLAFNPLDDRGDASRYFTIKFKSNDEETEEVEEIFC